MPHIRYKPNRLRSDALSMIDQANEIIEEHSRLGIDLTLRQIYYKFVKANLIANDEKNYKKLGSALNEGRLCGLIDWDGMEDRMRAGLGERRRPADEQRAGQAAPALRRRVDSAATRVGHGIRRVLARGPGRAADGEACCERWIASPPRRAVTRRGLRACDSARSALPCREHRPGGSGIYEER